MLLGVQEEMCRGTHTYTRRAFLRAIGLGPASLPAAKWLYAGGAPADKRENRPNILWISCEDISPDLGCYGDDYANTPNLDRLAEEGRRYTNAFVLGPGEVRGRRQPKTGPHTPWNRRGARSNL